MLCSKLVKKSFFGHSFLLLVLAAALLPDVGYSLPVKRITLIPDSTLPFSHKIKAASAGSFIFKTNVLSIKPNKNVSGFVKTYLKKEDEFLQKMKGKSRSFFSTIEKVFTQYDLPVQLKYLAIVESELQSDAKSPMGARGLWQLMPETARDLGLKVRGKIDERLYSYRSTVAAAKYLKQLYSQFDDWLLVLAAYNSGPGTVSKAIKKSGSKNYWALQRFLPPESRGHVKRFIGIHYFFEGEGSIVTLTKTEAKAWKQRMADELARQNADAALSPMPVFANANLR